MKDRVRRLILTIAYHDQTTSLAQELRGLKNAELSFKNHEYFIERNLPCLCCDGWTSVREERLEEVAAEIEAKLKTYAQGLGVDLGKEQQIGDVLKAMSRASGIPLGKLKYWYYGSGGVIGVPHVEVQP